MATDASWYVPGSPHGLQIVPPRTWRRDVLLVAETPPSMNTNQIRSNWRGYHKHKKKWQEEIQTLLMVAGLPRDNQRAIAGAILRFPKRAARRDGGNFAGLIEKALGDALAYRLDEPHRRYIPDDDDAHYSFVGVEFDEEIGDALTRIFVFTQPKEEPDGPG